MVPSEKDLKNASNLDSLGFCQKLLQADGPLFFEKHEIPDNARQARKRGWIMLEEAANSDTQADFPSLFHRSRVSYLLLGRQALPPAVEAMTLIEFVSTVVASFSRSALQHPERHVSGSKPSVSERVLQSSVSSYRGARTLAFSRVWNRQ